MLVVELRMEPNLSVLNLEKSVDEDLGPDLTPAIPLAVPKCRLNLFFFIGLNVLEEGLVFH